jgi:phosphonate transport system substrate-binding protein
MADTSTAGIWSRQSTEQLRVVNFLSPLLQSTYDAIAYALGARVGRPVTTGVGQSLRELAQGQADVAFLCGLQYVRAQLERPGELELLAAPVLAGARYQHQPVYFSDVVVRAESPYHTLEDLAGERWAYNEESSHSGYNLVYVSLLERGLALPYFGTQIRSGAHLKSLQLVLHGEVAATAIDSHIMDVVRLRDEQAAQQIRVIDTFGPSTIPPVVVAAHLDPVLKQELRAALLTLHRDAQVAASLHNGAITQFVPIEDEHYDDIRAMLACVTQHSW